METYQDNYQQDFADVQDMANTLKTGKYVKAKVKDIRIQAIEKFPAGAEIIGKELKINASPDVIMDTMEHTRLVAEIPYLDTEGIEKKEIFLLRDTAIDSLSERARIKGYAIGRLTPEKRALVFNECLRLWKERTAVYINESKVSAFLGGKTYSPLAQDKLFTCLLRALEQCFPGYSFIKGFTNHRLTMALFRLPDMENKEVKEYKREIREVLHQNTEFDLALQYLTSDIGVSSATLNYCLFTGNGNVIPIGYADSLAHKKKATVEVFEKMALNVYSVLNKSIEAIRKLLYMELQYPIHAMTAVAKKYKLPKKAAMEAIRRFGLEFGEGPATAHEAYVTLCNVQYLASPPMNEMARLKFRENAAKMMKIDWKKYDYAMPLEW